MIGSDTGPFALIPEWLLYSPIGDKALRLYAVLSRYADQSGKAWPSRALLGRKMACTTKTIDRALEELAQIGAVKVTGRVRENGQRTSNAYFLQRAEATFVSPAQTTNVQCHPPTDVQAEVEPVGTRAIEEELRAARATRDRLWDALVTACGEVVTEGERSRRGKVVKKLLAIGATPDEVLFRANALRGRWKGEAEVTDTALVNHWSKAVTPAAGGFTGEQMLASLRADRPTFVEAEALEELEP